MDNQYHSKFFIQCKWRNILPLSKLNLNLCLAVMDSCWLTEKEQTSESLSLFVLFTLFQCLRKIGHKSPIISELSHKSVLPSASVGSCYRKVKNGKGRRKMKSVKPHYISLLQQCSHAAYKLSIPSYCSVSIKMIMPAFYSGEMGCLKLCRAPAAVPRVLAQVLIELMVVLGLNHGKVNWKAIKYLLMWVLQGPYFL